MSSDFHTPSRHPGLAQSRAAARRPQPGPRQGLPLWAKVLAVLVVAALSLGLFRFVDKRKAQDQQMKEAAVALEATVQKMKEASDKGDFSQLKIDTTSGPAKTPAEVMQRVMLRAVEQRQAYERELAPLKLDEVLLPGPLSTAQGMSDAKERLSKARTVIARYQSMAADIITKSGQEIDLSALSSDQKETMKAGFLRGQEQGMARANEKWALEVGVVNEMAAMVQFLDNRRSAWRPDGGQFSFSNQADMGTFNRHMNEIRRISTQSAALEQQGFDTAQQQLHRLKQ